MITRRGLMRGAAASVFAPPRVVEAQPAGKVWRIGLLMPVAIDPTVLAAFTSGLRELGYEARRNIVIERRSAAGEFARLPSLAAELVRAKVDAIVAVK